MVDLKKEESFTFLGFEFRRVLSLQRKWRPYYAPKLKKRTALYEKSERSSDSMSAGPSRL
jgi:RNA-directed DNA polymerase